MRFDDSRRWAVLLTLFSGMLVLSLALLTSIVLPELRMYYTYQRTELTTAAKWLLLNLARHNNAFIGYVVCWFWLPMVINLVSAHAAHRDEHAFARRFAFGLIFCWILLGLALTWVALLCVTPMIILLQEIGPPPSPIAELIPQATGLLVAATAVLCVARMYPVRRYDFRVRRGRCGECGYDVRASGARCSECGASVAGHTP